MSISASDRLQPEPMEEEEEQPEVDLDALLGPRNSDIKLVYSDVVVARPSAAVVVAKAPTSPQPPKDKEEEEEDPKKKAVVVRFVGRGATQTSMTSMVTATKRPPVDKEARARERQERKRQREQEKLDEQQRAEEQIREQAMIAQALVAEAMYKKRKRMEEEYLRDHAVLHTGSENPERFAVVHQKTEWKDGVNLDDADKRCNLTRYYGSEAFPVATIVELATRNRRVPLEHVEFGFVINDSFWRNRRFPSGHQLKEFLMKMRPQRLELGPVHPSKLKTQEPYANMPLQKYLVFDCDMEDASDRHPRAYVRRCACKGAARVCAEGCWFYMRVAVKCLTYVLKAVLGCRTMVPVYSGRRGVHVWVLDERFLTNSEEERAAIVARIKLLGKPWRYDHSEYSAYLYDFILRDAFYANFLDGPRIVAAPEVANIITDMVAREKGNTTATVLLPDQAIEALVRVQMEVIGNPEAARRAWDDFCVIMSASLVPDFERRFIFRMMYPRLDEDVTVKDHHLVKFPFVIHPGSRRCAIPIPDVDTWKPEDAPRLSELMAYAEQFERDGGGEEGERDPKFYHYGRSTGNVKPNPLAPYVAHFSKMLAAEYPLMGTFLK